jgi:dipeptidase E
MKLLLLSNSANQGSGYLEYPKAEIHSFFGQEVVNVLFIPFAGVTIGYNEYEVLVGDRIDQMGNYHTSSIHRHKDYKKAIEKADAIVIGGGNTYMLLHLMQKHDLLEPIRQKVRSGTPYLGWSAGANVACPTIRTTNDMPIVWPQKMQALNLVPFQINPHFVEPYPGYAGESREMRLREFVEVNRDIYVIGLREGTLLRILGDQIDLIGLKKAKLIHSNKEAQEINPGDNLDFLLG